MNDLMPALRRRVGDEPSDALLGDLILEAETFAKCYTGLDELPPALAPVLVSYAAISFDRLGAEGETRHREGDVEMSFDAGREEILRQLNRYRLASVGLDREGAAIC